MEAKSKWIEKFQKHDKDTGSPEVQVALLTDRINHLTKHCNEHKKDFHTRQGLLKMVGARRRHLDYLKKIDISRYQGLIQELGLRK
ncbi:MAG: 30S ribosomal protein S15 [Bdellovibrionota bacterium]